MRSVSLVAGAGALLLTGCFYVDPINRRPQIGSVQRVCDGSEPGVPCDFTDLHRGDSVRIKAMFTDPDSAVENSSVTWVISACDSSHTMCDLVRSTQDSDAIAAFTVPSTLQDLGGPVQSVVVGVTVYDDRGASSESLQQLDIVGGPTLALSRSARTYTVGAPIDMFATYGDPDGDPPTSGPPVVALRWKPITPDGQAAPALIELDVPPNPGDPAHGTAGMRLIPPSPGVWDVQVTATNTHQQTNVKDLTFTVAPDLPPCLEQWQPIVPPDGATLPIAEPTLFEVPLVTDDLDPYPPVRGEPLLGTTRFEWSIQSPGGAARQPLVGATGATVDFDPAAFTPGEIVELRVEIFDRNHAAVACPDAEPICAVTALPSCNRRQTWRVEIR